MPTNFCVCKTLCFQLKWIKARGSNRWTAVSWWVKRHDRHGKAERIQPKALQLNCGWAWATCWTPKHYARAREKFWNICSLGIYESYVGKCLGPNGSEISVFVANHLALVSTSIQHDCSFISSHISFNRNSMATIHHWVWVWSSIVSSPTDV